MSRLNGATSQPFAAMKDEIAALKMRLDSTQDKSAAFLI